MGARLHTEEMNFKEEQFFDPSSRVVNVSRPCGVDVVRALCGTVLARQAINAR